MLEFDNFQSHININIFIFINFAYEKDDDYSKFVKFECIPVLIISLQRFYAFMSRECRIF